MGDILEDFPRITAARGPAAARRWFWRQAIQSGLGRAVATLPYVGGGWRQDLAFVGRTLWRRPGFTAAAVITLALGIGANAAAFGMVDALLYRSPPGVGEPEGVHRVRIVSLTPSPDGSRVERPVWSSYPVFEDLQEQMEGFFELSAYRYRNVIEGHGADAREIRALSVSSDYFSVLQVDPAIGRFWTRGEDRDAEPVVVLSHGFWRRRFAGDHDIIGRTLVLSEIPVTVIGVAPPHFRGIDLEPVDVWLPLGLEALRTPEILESRDITWLWLLGRQTRDLGAEVVETRATTALRDAARETGDAWGFSSAAVDLTSISDPFTGYGRDRPVPVWLMGVTAVVLLIACANVSSLLLARGAGRRRELAVRTALGASRGRIVQLLLVESLVLALMGGVVGVAVAWIAAKLVHLVDIPPLDPFLDVRVAGFAFAVALLTSLAVGILPARRASRADVEGELKDGAPRASYDRSRTRAVLTVAQVALSVVLLVNAGLFVRSLHNVRALQPGLAPRTLAVVSLRFPGGTDPEHIWSVKEEAVEQLPSLPEVASAALTTGAPYASGLGITAISGEALGLPQEERVEVVSLRVGPGYFRAVGLAPRTGRTLEVSDGPDAEPVVVVNATLARVLGGDREALGHCMPDPDGCARVVGVVPDSRFFDPSEDPLPAQYRSVAQAPLAITASRAFLLVRTEVPVAEIAVTLRRGITGIAPDVQFVEVESMSDLLRPRLQPWRMAMLIFSLSGAMAFLLAAVGLHGVIAYLVASRTHELGVRIALGAHRRRVVGLVLQEGARLAAIGAGIGLVIAPAVSHLLRHRMYGVTPSDPLTYAAVTLLVVAVASATSVLSARRAAKVDPAVALRSE